ncbi:MAG: TIGR03643 family protein [Bacteroidota bacterium]
MKQTLTTSDISRIIEMAWEDRTPFEAIQMQFGLAEKETIALMRKEMTSSSFKMWRERVSGRNTKHRQKRSTEVTRFVSPMQGKRLK